MNARIATAAIALLVICPAAVWADARAPVEPETLWRAWNWDLLLLLNLGLLGWLYFRGLTRLWRKAGLGRGVSHAQAGAYLASLAMIFVALVSPLDALSAELASAHMVQHMLLMVVAAPLFVVGSPALVLTWGLPRDWRPIAGRWRRGLAADVLKRPLLPWLLYAATLWVWHFPACYQAALGDPLVHDAQHLSFFVAACLFWRVLVDPLRRRQLHPATAVLSLFTTSLHATLLGVFMTLSPALWYDVYAARTPAWGHTPLEDQQLAGLIMWMPACLVYPAVAAVVVGLWLSTTAATGERQDRRLAVVPLKGG